jgi:hypothetical protein
MTMQGSFVMMKRSWYDKCGFMKLKGYTGWGQEGEELCLTTLQNSGRAVVNKNKAVIISTPRSSPLLTISRPPLCVVSVDIRM